jgi:hypothetical protein
MVLEHMAQRIRNRAVERGGVLLAAMEKQKGGRPKTRAGDRPSLRKAAAKAAGLSPHQAKEMLRVGANKHD